MRAGLLGRVVALPAGQGRAEWVARGGEDVSRVFPTRQEAETALSREASRGLRFHDDAVRAILG